MSVALRSGLPTSAIQVESLRLNAIRSWNQIGGPAGQIYAGNFGLVATDPQTGDLHHYLGQPGQWARIGGPGRTFASDETGRLFGLSPDGSGVYQYTGNGRNDSWVNIGGPAGQIYAGDFGLLGIGLVATNPQTGDLYHYLGQPGQWARIGGPGRTFAFSTGRLFRLSPDGLEVDEYMGNGSNDSWFKIGGPAGQIYAGNFGLVATDPQTGDLHHYLEQPGQWARIGGPGRTFALSGDFAELYGLSPDGSAVYQYTGDGSNDSWAKIWGPADAIAVPISGGDNALYALSPGTHNVWRYSY